MDFPLGYPLVVTPYGLAPNEGSYWGIVSLMNAGIDCYPVKCLCSLGSFGSFASLRIYIACLTPSEGLRNVMTRHHFHFLQSTHSS